MSGGGPSAPPTKFLFQINNFGKTPGELFWIRYGFVPLGAETPAVPVYTRELYWHDWYKPQTQSKDIPPLGDLEFGTKGRIFGRYYYRDIFKKWHSAGFILGFDARGGTESVDAPDAYTDERDEKGPPPPLPPKPDAESAPEAEAAPGSA